MTHRSNRAKGPGLAQGLNPHASVGTSTGTPARGIARFMRRAFDTILGHEHGGQEHRSNAGLDRFEDRFLLTVNVVNPVNDFLVFQNSQPTSIRIDDRFDDDAISGQVVQFQSVLGDIFVELFESQTPITTANFLRYADNNLYDNTVIHRSIAGFVVQGGGFEFPGLEAINTFNPIQNEPGISNTRGTIAMAKLGGDPNSATSQWFFNLADNSGNLNNQNGGFTVFGRVLGDGMSVADAIAALPTEDLGSPFDEIPLRNYTGGDPTADNVVLFQTITRTGELTFTVTSSNGALVTPQVIIVDGQARLQLTYGAGLGEANITIRALSRGGDFVEDTFNVRVVNQELASPTLGEVRVSPDFVASPGPDTLVTLTALNVVDNDGTVSLVEYYRDNGDGVFSPDTDTLIGSSSDASTNYRITAPTAAGPATVRYFARAQDNDFLFGAAKTVTNTQNTPPVIGTFTVSSASVTRPSSLTLEVRNVVDSSGVSRVEFWRDINSNGTFESDVDVRIGSATNIGGRFRLTFDARILPAGTIPFLAVAFDPQGLSGINTASVQVVNFAPTFNGISGALQVAVRGLNAEMSVILPRDRDGTLQGAEYWLDVNGNSIIDPDVDTLVARGDDPTNNYRGTWSTSQFNLGISKIMVRVVDDDNAPSATQVVNFRVNRAPQIGSLTLVNSTVETNSVVSIRALDVFDPDGTLNGVEIFWDRDNTGSLERQLFDRLLGRAVKNGSTWTLTFFASILYDNFNNRLFAQAIDAEGARSPAVPIQVQIVRPGAPSPAQNPYDPTEFRLPDGTLITDMPEPRGVTGSVRRVWNNTLAAQAATSEDSLPTLPSSVQFPVLTTSLTPFHAESTRSAISSSINAATTGATTAIQLRPWAQSKSLLSFLY